MGKLAAKHCGSEEQFQLPDLSEYDGRFYGSVTAAFRSCSAIPVGVVEVSVLWPRMGGGREVSFAAEDRVTAPGPKCS
jgi:hypothetical protein